MDENENSYKKVVINHERRSSGFGKSVLIPFASSIIGTTLVIGVCFGIPSVKEKIIGGALQNSVISTSSSSAVSATPNLVSLSNFSDTTIGVAEAVLPSVVGIKVEYSVNSIFSYQTSTASASGSGVIISSDGYILTNNHIVNTASSSSFYQLSEATKVTVNLHGDENEYEAKIIGTDPQTDLAVIKIDKTGLTPAKLGNSDSLKVGEYVMAIGNPLGMQNSVTGGIVSAVNREVTGDDGTKYILIQTDAAINSGNSGGALVNSKGEVVGINTLKLSGTGIEGMGFAIPINSTVDIYDQLIKYSKVKRPYIGIAGINLDVATAEKNKLPVGIYVRSVEDFSSAQKSGLKPGDVIIEADGKSVKTMEELNAIKNTYKIGDEIKLKISRDGKEYELTVTLAEQD